MSQYLSTLGYEATTWLNYLSLSSNLTKGLPKTNMMLAENCQRYHCILPKQKTAYSKSIYQAHGGWSGGAKVLGKLPVPGRPTYLDYSRARAYCACSRCGWGCLDIFSLIYHCSFLSPSLWETARYRLKYCLKGPLSPKQPTNQQPSS